LVVRDSFGRPLLPLRLRWRHSESRMLLGVTNTGPCLARDWVVKQKTDEENWFSPTCGGAPAVFIDI
jgi:hypothetical protein